MRSPRIFVFEQFQTNILAHKMSFLYVHKLTRRRHKFTRFWLLVISILSLVGCQPSLWGAPPPPPTIAVSTAIPFIASATATIQIPTLAPTITPMPPTAAPTPVVLDAAQVWASPAVPKILHEKFQSWGFQVLTTDQSSANLYIDVVQAPVGATHVSNWTYALVAPFPTLIDNVASQELLSVWSGTDFGPFVGIPLLMDQTTLEAFTRLWGPPVEGAVQVVPSDQLLDTAWNQMPSWAIIPFENIEPKWKVLMIDGQSPIQKKFDPAIYPLTVSYRLMCMDSCQVPSGMDFSFQNRDPQRMTTLIMTGVTAMSRATAQRMEQKGVLYPGEVIRDFMREADITHINNEVPFFSECPAPDPNQPEEVFCSEPDYIDLMTDMGTDVVELSGDHFADYKAVAMYETLDIYRKNNLLYYGGGYNVEDGRKPLLMEVNGNKIMFIACNYKTIYASATDTVPGAVPCDFPYMTEQIAYYHSQGYLIISSFQYHEFAEPEARPQQMIDFRRMADAGATIVSGSQAHVPQVMEFYNDAFIHYGLGNLFFDQMDPRGPKLTEKEFFDRHVFYDGRYLGVELITARLTDYSRPVFMTEAERNGFLAMYFAKSGWDFPQVKR
ncbi:MAG: CapA family protein [Chloroflexi bacterium]|nr:CapA family protein [Chloroflexota bacterium]